MHKTLTGGLIIMTTVLFVGGIFFPDHITMWLASPAPLYSILRLVVFASLIVLYFSEPPRSRPVRLFFATVSGLLFGVVFVEIVNGTNNLLDIMMLAQMAIVLKLEAIEYQPNYLSNYRLHRRSAA